MDVLGEVRSILVSILNLKGGERGLEADTRLLGSIPELDSMAVVSVITAIEERFGVAFDDEEITAEAFESLGTLSAFTESKIKAA